MSFTAGPPPIGFSIEEAIGVIWSKFFELERELYFLAIPRIYAAPFRPQDGQLVYADGSSWDPGSGRGVYRYDSTSAGWVFLG